MSWLDSMLAAYSTVQINGVTVPQERILNFVSGVTATDDPSNGRTNLTVSGGGGGGSGYQTIEGNGLAVTQRTTVNIIGAASVVDNSGASRTDIQVGPSTSASDGFYLIQMTGGVPSYVVATSDMISAGLTVSISGSSNGTFECGATWTTTGITCSPACNAAGVTAASINDTNGGTTNVLGVANPLSSPSATYSKSTSGQTVGISVTMTKGGFTKTSNSLTSTWVDRYFVGQGTTGDATGATASGNNAALSGGTDSGTLTGTLATFPVGATFSIGASGTPKYTYLWVAHTSSAMTFKSGGAPFPMTRVTSNASFTNQFSVVHGFDLYVSNALTQAYTVVRDT